MRWAGLGTAVFVRYDHATGDLVTASWPPAKELVPRATSATTPGDPEPGWGILALDGA
jgi:hypothetical protein